MHSDHDSIHGELERFMHLQECVLLDVVWKHQGTIIELHFDYVWDKDGIIRRDLDRVHSVRVVFSVVQEFILKNFLSDMMIRRFDQLDWGMSEISQIGLQENSKLLSRYENPAVPLHHAVVSWENQRRIDIIFSRMEIEIVE